MGKVQNYFKTKLILLSDFHGYCRTFEVKHKSFKDKKYKADEKREREGERMIVEKFMNESEDFNISFF